MVVVVLLLIGTVIKFSPWQNAGKSGKLIAWDVTSYYAYLPATFIEKDIRLTFVEKDSTFYHEHQMYWPETAPNGSKVIKTTMGLSFLYSPFFFVADAIDDDSSKARGFSETFEFWLVISSLFFTILGAIFLRSFLLKHFTDHVVSLTLISIYFGTNLFYYITVEPLMPHAYNFFLISLFLYFTDRWHNCSTFRNSLVIGLTLGLITLIRPVNGVVLLFFLTYQLEGITKFKNRLKLFYEKLPLLLVISLAAMLMLLPQLIYWKSLTGQFIYNSYSGEQFFFTNPHIIDGLFSYRKGWLLYTPIMIFGLIGLGLSIKNRISSLIVLVPTVYIMFSWWNWWYGGSFGCRPIIDFYPILAIGLGSLLSKALETKWSKFSTLSIFGLLICFNLFQTLQKKSDAIHWESMTKEAYWHNFLHRYPQPGYQEKLHHPDIEKAKQGFDEY